MDSNTKLMDFLYRIKIAFGFKSDIPEFFFVGENELINISDIKSIKTTVEWFSQLLDGTHKLNDNGFYIHPIFIKDLTPVCIEKFKVLLAKTIYYEIQKNGECKISLKRTQTSKAFQDIIKFCGLSLDNFPSPLEVIVNKDSSIYYVGYGVPTYIKSEEDEITGKRIIIGREII